MKSKIYGILYFILLTFLFCIHGSVHADNLLVSGINHGNKFTTEEIKNFFIMQLADYNNIIFSSVPRGLVISVPNEMLFKEQESVIKEDAKSLLYILSEGIKYIDGLCVIEGNLLGNSNTDELYNLELSVIRAENIVEYLIKHCNVKPNMIRAIGFGDMLPFADNVSSGGNLNERIDFVILNYQLGR